MEASWLYTIFSLVLLILAYKFSTTRKWKLPPSPVALPLIGHLYLLKMPIHRTYLRLSEKLGPIFILKFGSRRMVVVSSPSLVEECFKKNDVVLANRPHFIVSEYFGYNDTSLASANYGEHWRNLRKLFMVEVFSTARLNVFQHTRQDETMLMLKRLYRSSKHEFSKVDLKDVITGFTFNIVMRMVTGKRYFDVGDDQNEEAKNFQENMEEMAKLGGAANPADLFPMFRWLFRGREKYVAKIGEKLDSFFQSLVDEQRGKNENTLVDHLLSLQESEPEYYSDIIIKGIILAILFGGTDTQMATLEWGMAVLLNNPDKVYKARAELDMVVGNNRLVNESDLAKLPYLQNIVSEIFRLFPAAPLLVPHEPSADCKIGGYDIPKGSILLVNVWAIHRDPTIWDDPETFKPERFDHEQGEVARSKLIHFGMGRRSCPGYGLAQWVMALALGSLIQCFDWERTSEAMVDMTEGMGISNPKAIPLEANCKARDVLHNFLSSPSV